jgi:hypothetical protein
MPVALVLGAHKDSFKKTYGDLGWPKGKTQQKGEILRTCVPVYLAIRRRTSRRPSDITYFEMQFAQEWQLFGLAKPQSSFTTYFKQACRSINRFIST